MTNNLSVRQVVWKLNEHIQKLQAGTYLSRLDLPPASPGLEFHLSDNEQYSRRASLEAFTKLPHYQKVDKSVSDRFLKELYPHHSQLGQFYTKFKTHNNVNHSSLYESYCQLPQPGVAHMKYQDFEVFMKEFTYFRKWVRPNKLSSTNIPLLRRKNILQLYLDSLAVRKEHLNALLHITQDMKMAGIPISNHERHVLVYKTFYRDRPDILHQVRMSLRDNPYYKKPVLKALHKLPLDMDSFSNLKDSFGDSLSIETLNTFLFLALRHGDKDVCAAVLANYAPDSYNRDTFKILIENLAFHKGSEYLKYLELLVTKYPFLIDIKLVNIILSSLVTVGHSELAESVLATILSQEFPSLEPSEMYLKLLSYEDKQKYSQVLSQYDALPERPYCILQPTAQTFLPILKAHCEQKTGFPRIFDLLLQVENVAKLPLTSQMFKYVYQSFARRPGRLQDLQYMTGRLIELHDINQTGQDSWSKEVINEGALPDNLVAFLNASSQETPEYDVNGSNFIKLSSELMTIIFEAYKVSLDRQQKLLNEVLIIEDDLNKSLSAAVMRNKYSQPMGRNQQIPLSKLDEIIYMRKMSLIKLFDLGHSV